MICAFVARPGAPSQNAGAALSLSPCASAHQLPALATLIAASCLDRVVHRQGIRKFGDKDTHTHTFDDTGTRTFSQPPWFRI